MDTQTLPVEPGTMVDRVERAQHAILAQVRMGTTLKKVAATIGVSPSIIYYYRTRNPQFERELQQAMIQGGEYLLDDLRESLIYDLNQGVDVAVVRLKKDIIVTWLEKRFPAQYGQRQTIDVRHAIDISGALQRARQRVADAQVIDGEVVSRTALTDTQSVKRRIDVELEPQVTDVSQLF